MPLNRGIKKVFVTPLTGTNANDVEGLGVIRFEGDSVYKWCKFTAANVVAPGDCVTYDATAHDGLTVNGVTGPGAGLAMAAIPAGTAPVYGWIQVAGLSNDFGANTSWTVPGAAGNELIAVGATYPAMIVKAAVANMSLAMVINPGAAGTGLIMCAFAY